MMAETHKLPENQVIVTVVRAVGGPVRAAHAPIIVRRNRPHRGAVSPPGSSSGGKI